MKIREIVQSDFADVAALFAELADEAISEDQAPFLKTLHFQGTHMFGAEVNGHIVSMATLHMLPNLGGRRTAYGLVENVATLRQFQGQGIGRAVMEKLLGTAWANGAYKVMLLTGTEAGASGFYEKLGFSGDSKIGMQVRKIPARKSKLKII